MLDLDSPRWKELDHAFGKATDIPALLRQLEANPNVWSDRISFSPEPWAALGSALCHQFDVYNAAYAAVPHIFRIAGLAKDPLLLDYFCLPALIEEWRPRFGPQAVPDDLRASYFATIKRLPVLLPRIAAQEWDEPVARHVASGLAGLKGFSFLARAIIDWTLPNTIVRLFHSWCRRRPST